MQYIEPYPSTVPHIILTPPAFDISTQYYSISNAIQIIFLLLTLAILLLLLISRYQNQRSSFEKQQPNQQQSANNIICNDKNVNVNDEDISHGLSQLSKFDKLQKTRSVWGIDFHEDERVTASNYQFYERKLTYLIVYLGIYVLSVNSFDSGIITIISLVLQISLFVIFNMLRCCQNWKITMFFFMVPGIMGFFQFYTGNHKLYQQSRII